MAAVETGNGNDDGSVGSGGINFTRPAVEIWWDPGQTPEETPVTIRAENAETGVVGIKHGINDGLSTLTYPAGTRLVDHITVHVKDAPEEVIAQFDISIRIND